MIQWSDIQLPTSWLSKNESYQQKCKLILKLNGKKYDDSTVSSSPPPLETILTVYEEFTITAFPFKLPGEHPEFEKIIEIMIILITNQCLKNISKQLGKLESKTDEGSSSNTPSSSKTIEKSLIHVLLKIKTKILRTLKNY